jgi:hypothetical protein
MYLPALIDLLDEKILKKLCENADLKKLIGNDLYPKICKFVEKIVKVVKNIFEK